MFLPILAVIGSIVSLCVGSSFAKQLFSHIGAEGAATLRVGFAAIILLAIWRPWRLHLSRGDAKAIFLYGAVLGAMNLFFYLGINRIPLGVAIAIEFMGPLAIAVYSSRRALDFLWISFAVLGLVLLLPLKASANSLDPVGVAYIIGAAICWAAYIVFGKSAGKGHAGLATSLGVTVAALVVLPFGASHVIPALHNQSYILVGLVVAVLSSAIPYTLEMFALKRLQQQTFGILMSLEPAVGAVAGWIILKEILTPIQWLAIASIIVASIGTTLGLRKPQENPLTDLDGIAPEDEVSTSAEI